MYRPRASTCRELSGWPIAGFALPLLLAILATAFGATGRDPHRASAPIAVDGDLSEPAWHEAARVADWVETNPGDNVEPKVASVGYLAYDERFLYVGFEFADPDPAAIRAPLGDRDNVPSYTDYAGIFVDGTADGRTAQMFLANPRGIQYDALTNDATGEDSAPDWFWESAARITASRLGARDAHPLRLAALPRRESREVGDPPLPQPPPRFPLPDVQLGAAERQRLPGLPRPAAGRARRTALGSALGGGARTPPGVASRPRSAAPAASWSTARSTSRPGST